MKITGKNEFFEDLFGFESGKSLVRMRFSVTILFSCHVVGNSGESRLLLENFSRKVVRGRLRLRVLAFYGRLQVGYCFLAFWLYLEAISG